MFPTLPSDALYIPLAIARNRRDLLVSLLRGDSSWCPPLRRHNIDVRPRFVGARIKDNELPIRSPMRRAGNTISNDTNGESLISSIAVRPPHRRFAAPGGDEHNLCAVRGQLLRLSILDGGRNEGLSVHRRLVAQLNVDNIRVHDPALVYQAPVRGRITGLPGGDRLDRKRAQPMITA